MPIRTEDLVTLIQAGLHYRHAYQQLCAEFKNALPQAIASQSLEPIQSISHLFNYGALVDPVHGLALTTAARMYNKTRVGRNLRRRRPASIVRLNETGYNPMPADKVAQNEHQVTPEQFAAYNAWLEDPDNNPNPFEPASPDEASTEDTIYVSDTPDDPPADRTKDLWPAKPEPPSKPSAKPEDTK